MIHERCEDIFFATNRTLQIQRMSENNESATQNADVAFQLRALCQQLELLSRMNMDLTDDVKWIRKQNIGADRRGNTIRKTVPNTRSDFDVVADENTDVGEEDYDGDMESRSDRLMRTGPETPARTRYMFRGLVLKVSPKSSLQ